MKLAHSSPFAGHLGINKTTHRLMQNCYWSGFTKGVKNFCKCCPEFQKQEPKGRTPQAYLQDTDMATRPFHKIVMDIIGPLKVMSSKGNIFILIIVDVCSRYPEANSSEVYHE